MHFLNCWLVPLRCLGTGNINNLWWKSEWMLRLPTTCLKFQIARYDHTSLWTVLAWNVFEGCNRLLGVDDDLLGVGAGGLVAFEYFSCITSSTTFLVTWIDNPSICSLSNSGQSFPVLVSASSLSFTALSILNEWLLLYLSLQLSSLSESTALFA